MSVLGKKIMQSLMLALSLFTALCFAQTQAPANDKPASPVANSNAELKAEPKEAKANPEAVAPAKKMVQDATINLQTTVTGNQEQPRVLYILPWQNPTTGNVDFESLDNEQKAVFGHVEREELRRELEAAGEL